jgi:hypothetical protein
MHPGLGKAVLISEKAGPGMPRSRILLLFFNLPPVLNIRVMHNDFTES